MTLASKMNFLFDWDGCLVDSLDFWLESYGQVFSDYHIEISPREIIDEIFGNPDGPIKFGVNNAIEFKEKVYELFFKKVKKGLHFNIEAINLLEKLKSGGYNVVITSSTRRIENIKHILVQEKIEHLFDYILIGTDVEKVKPNPEVVVKAMGLLGANPEDTVIIGDSDVDILAGKGAGISTILYFPENHSKYYNKEKFLSSEPDYIVRSFNELDKLIFNSD